MTEPMGAVRQLPITYLDYAATSPLRAEALAAMEPFFGARFGNPSGSHGVAGDAKAALEEARDEMAELLGAAPGEVVFTGSGTEADNLAVLGALAARAAVNSAPGAVLCSAVEHHAVLESCHAAAKGVGNGRTLELRLAPVDPDGILDLQALEQLLGPEIALVSVMLANNETGAIEPLDSAAAIVRKHAPEALIHTDAVQAAPWMDLAAEAKAASLVSVSAHKFGGPKGVGALVVRRGAVIHPILYGGGQERELRSGTHNVAGVVGMAAALRVTYAQREMQQERVRMLRDRLAQGLLDKVEGTRLCTPLDRSLPGHCNIRFSGVQQEDLLVLLDQRGICASGGSACASGALEPSHVMLAMGLTPSESRSAVRFSLGYASSEADVTHALACVPEAVARLRK